MHYNTLSEIHVNEILSAWRFKAKIIRISTFEVFGSGPFWSYILGDINRKKTEMIIPPSEEYRFEGLEKGEGNWIEIFCVKVLDPYKGFRHVNCPFYLTVTENTRIYAITAQNNHHYMEFKSIHAIKNTTDVQVPIDTMGVVFNVEPFAVSPDPKMSKIVFHIRDNTENQIKCIAIGDAAYGFKDEYELNTDQEVIIVVLKMWRIHKFSSGDAEPWLETHKGLSNLRINPRLNEVDNFRRELRNNSRLVQPMDLLFLLKYRSSLH